MRIPREKNTQYFELIFKKDRGMQMRATDTSVIKGYHA